MTANAKMQAKNVGVFYGENDALRGINLDIHARRSDLIHWSVGLW